MGEKLTDIIFVKAGSFESGLLEKRWSDFSFAEEGGENLKSVQERNLDAIHN